MIGGDCVWFWSDARTNSDIDFKKSSQSDHSKKLVLELRKNEVYWFAFDICGCSHDVCCRSGGTCSTVRPPAPWFLIQ